MPEDRAREKAYARTVCAIKNDFFRLFRNIPGTDPTNPERRNLPGYLVGHRGEGRLQSGEEGSAQTQTQIRSLFEFDPDEVEDDNQEFDGHDSVDAELPSRVPGY